MCRSTTNNAEFPPYPKDRDRLKIRAFYLRLRLAEKPHGGGGGRRAVPETLTLVYLPRIDGGALEVNGSKVRDGAPAIAALHRVRSEGPGSLFASTERVRVGDGARFEAYAWEEKVVRGVFRRGGGGGGWRMECRGCEEAGEEIVAAEVWVVGVSGVVLRERVEIAAEEEKGRRRRRRTTLGLGFRSKLEEIPEESDGCDCCCCEGGADDQEKVEEEEEEVVVGLDRRDWREEEEGMEGGDWGLEMEGVRWAVDAGIWVVCLGVGLFCHVWFEYKIVGYKFLYT